LRSEDPDGVIEANIETRRLVGCVVYPAGEILAPGVVHHVEGDRFPVGELDGSHSERAARVSELLVNAGLKSPVLDDIRAEVWLKLWGNMSFNPISALTHATLVDICQEPSTRALAANMMTEAQTIAEKLGVTFRVPLEKRIAGAERVGKHKTSTLQDVEAGRPVEIDALIGSVIELGELTGVPTPSTSAVYALMKLLDKTMTVEHAKVVLQTACVRSGESALAPVATADPRYFDSGFPVAAYKSAMGTTRPCSGSIRSTASFSRAMLSTRLR
jgi:2-dehydropantoate 2-reductase